MSCFRDAVCQEFFSISFQCLYLKCFCYCFLFFFCQGFIPKFILHLCHIVQYISAIVLKTTFWNHHTAEISNRLIGNRISNRNNLFHRISYMEMSNVRNMNDDSKFHSDIKLGDKRRSKRFTKQVGNIRLMLMLQ